MNQQAETLACRHSFHPTCIGAWKQKGRGLTPTCPECRAEIEETATARVAVLNRKRKNLN
ncbi:hypothetical protein BC937DRAFT_90157 [Endogone sp. FLAS-F59071]|nr:hypothetical protein BC937DRAFT_90157 [Endogone sp. FLAS-F59071]|eukprot:RUS17291.1 hypothetical protein BC937DRAFT_90157 [Endogone sp. FLAS-F59071]